MIKKLLIGTFGLIYSISATGIMQAADFNETYNTLMDQISEGDMTVSDKDALSTKGSVNIGIKTLSNNGSEDMAQFNIRYNSIVQTKKSGYTAQEGRIIIDANLPVLADGKPAHALIDVDIKLTPTTLYVR